MNANELRIGNLVECKVFGDTYTDRFPHYGKNVFPVFSACKYFVKIDIGFDALRKVEIHEVKPIPLTEEWLLKFGFKKVNDNFITIESHHYENKNCWIYLIADGFELELNTLSERNNLCRTYKYVHQLQNLYFALTGEELTISE